MSKDKADVKIVFLGDTFVGKTCLIDRFINNNYSENLINTIGVSFASKGMTVGQKNIILGIWDTAGQERFNSMARMYYRKAHAAIVCYDLINRQSFEKLQQWIKELKENEANCKIYIVGTKYDLLKNHERVISKEEIDKYTNSHSAKYFETSAKTGFGIKKMFEVIAQEMISLNSKKKEEFKTNRKGSYYTASK